VGITHDMDNAVTEHQAIGSNHFCHG